MRGCKGQNNWLCAASFSAGWHGYIGRVERVMCYSETVSYYSMQTLRIAGPAICLAHKKAHVSATCHAALGGVVSRGEATHLP